MSVSDERGIPRSRSGGERYVRVVLGLAGLFLLAVGVHKLWVLPDRVSTLKWAFGPVVIHDALLAPIICVAGWAVSRVLPGWTRPAVLAGTVVTASLALVSLSVVGDEGVTRANPSLDPRNYGAGLLVAIVVVWCVVAVCLVVSARRARRQG